MTKVPSPRSPSSGSVEKRADINAFLDKVRETPQSDGSQAGLIFALDATMSRQATWDQAMNVQSAMFDAVGGLGSLAVQLVYFRGMGECRASKWVWETRDLRNLMTGISCRGGQTQIGKVLSHARKADGQSGIKPRALVFIGDAMEENPDALASKAGELGLLQLPVFAFQEGHDSMTEATFREMARLSGGAFMRFGPNSAAQLIELLKAVATYARGGRAALEGASSREARLLLEQLS